MFFLWKRSVGESEGRGEAGENIVCSSRGIFDSSSPTHSNIDPLAECVTSSFVSLPALVFYYGL